ncbi:MAG: nuclear transport factor 2 family protein [Kiritimatiellae bacterium]|nr:nuclear transport factor 2 family protein [Kiritimatiellia bacterium]
MPALLTVLLILGLVLGMCGCRSAPGPQSAAHALYHEALARTARPETDARLDPEAERAAIERFNAFYRVYSVESIRAGVRDVYAQDAYFGDPFQGVSGIDAIESYFVNMAEPVETCTFDIEGVDRAGAEYYFRWTMNLEVKRARGDLIRAPGVSHVRFGPDGKVIFQQDYWDASVLFERLPLVGPLTRWVKRRLE